MNEARVLADLAGLAGSDGPYVDLVQDVLDALTIDLAPLLCLSLTEPSGIAHYARLLQGNDFTWAEEAANTIAGASEAYLRDASVIPHGEHDPWFRSFAARTGSGRSLVLSLAGAEALALRDEDERFLQDLSEQALLVLDHALLQLQMEQLETADPVTGAASQRRLLEVLDYEIRRHHAFGRPLSLLVLDVKGLDRVNRRYGRRYGDHVLQKLAGLIAAEIRPVDIVGRCDGTDELAVLLLETDVEDAWAVADHLSSRLHGMELAGGEIGVSAGATTLRRGELPGAEELLRRAEQALDETKRQQQEWSLLGVR
jgi:diguanylate cyclase (GGDEF)-like protein